MPLTFGEGGTAPVGLGALQLAAQECAEAIDAVSRNRGRPWLATVTDSSFLGTDGFVYATIGTSIVRVITLSAVSAGQAIIVLKYDNGHDSPYIMIGLAANEIPLPGSDGEVPYGLDFPAPMSSPNGGFRVHWSGTIISIETRGVATFGLAIEGGAAVTVSDAVSAGDWILVTATAGSDVDSGIEVTIR
jgi:hypothetical protein